MLPKSQPSAGNTDVSRLLSAIFENLISEHPTFLYTDHIWPFSAHAIITEAGEILFNTASQTGVSDFLE
jgi:hypothetical protein